MADDDDRFRLMFYEEARELLISLEEGLVELEQRQGDRAHLDQTFRAAHSIKGAAGMVGLGAIAEATHSLEAVLDRIRSEKLAVDANLITTLLEAKDHLASMVEGEAAGAPIPTSPSLNQRLTALLDEPKSAQPLPPSSGPAPTPMPSVSPSTRQDEDERKDAASAVPETKPRSRTRKSRTKPAPVVSLLPTHAQTPSPEEREPKPTAMPESPPADPGSGPATYHIRLEPGPGTLRRGVNPLGVLDELRELGATRIHTDPGRVPPLDEIDSARCYLAWDIELESEITADRLEDVFLFVTQDSTITVERRARDGLEPPGRPSPAAATTAPTSRPAPQVVPAPTETAPADRPEETPSTPPTRSEAGPARPMETAPAATSPGPHRPAARIRVDAGQLDDLVGLAGELAVLSDNLQGLRDTAIALSWIHTLESLERVSRQIRETTLELRMVPVDELFSRFPRVVRDLADRSGKEIELRIIGQETRLDRTIIERLSEPMIHLIRNGVDHALESPEERQAAGKPRAGRITLMAGHEGDRVTIRVTDDGRGLDRVRIVRKGIAQGLVPVGTSPDDPRVDTLIFEPGFSTRDQVNELSGRGVGLDVVRDAVRGLRGSITVESVPGTGTSFIFRLPLTLALIDGLLVESGGSRYVVPLAQVEECVSLNGSRPALSQGRPCVAVRGELVPMVLLRHLFRARGEAPARQELLLTRHAGQRVGIAVDRLLGRVQAVIQALGEGLAGLSRFSGATILGDGSVSLILDLTALVTESRTADNPVSPPAGGRAEGF